MPQVLVRNDLGLPSMDYENRGDRIMGVCTSATVIVGLLVPLRLFVRATIVKWIGWDDWMIVMATASSITLNALAMASVSYGAGRHVTVIHPKDFKQGLKLNLMTQMLNLIAILFVKISICLFLARLAPTPIYNKITYGTVIFMTLYTIGCEFSIALQCTPMDKIWDRMGVEGNCMPIRTLLGLSYGYAAVNISTDFFLVCLPIPMIWTVHIPNRKKFFLILILALGLFASAASVVKLRYTFDYGKTGDFLWDSVDLTIWSVAEINVGIVCACMPALQPLFIRFFEKTGLSSDSRNAKKSNSGGQGTNEPHPLQSLSKSGAATGVRRVTIGSSKQTGKSSNDSEESIFARAGHELGIHIPENRSTGSLEEGYITATGVDDSKEIRNADWK